VDEDIGASGPATLDARGSRGEAPADEIAVATTHASSAETTIPLRVMYLTTASGVGGAEKQVHDLAVTMHARGWQVTAVSMLPLADVFADLPAAGIPTFTLGMTRGRPSLRAVWRLHRFIRAERPHVLHCHMIHANLLGRLTHLLDRQPVVISTMHNQNQGGGWRRLAYRLTDRLSDRTTTVSRMALEAAVSQGLAPRSRMLLMPNGVDVEAYAPDRSARERIRRTLAPNGEFLWLAVGRLTAAKDYANMVAAFAHAADGESASSRLVIAGEGPMARSVEALIEEAALGDRIRLLGPREDIPALMQAADGLVMSSAWEGLPLVLLEAGASGLPAVVTDVGGSRDVIVEGVTGHVVPPRDAVALAGAMSRVEGLSSEARRKMGLAAREHVTSRFDLDAVAARWEALYLDLLA
jgi:glycosyltransferase involved in cell wall biosynthesis